MSAADTFDARQVRRAFSRAAPGYDAAAALQREVEAQLLESLEFHAARHGDDALPQRVLDLGSGTGRAATAMRLLWTRLKLLVEPSSAIALAAVLQQPAQFAGRRVGIVLSGGNVDLDALPWA